jgi:hypothetical protein
VLRTTHQVFRDKNLTYFNAGNTTSTIAGTEVNAFSTMMPASHSGKLLANQMPAARSQVTRPHHAKQAHMFTNSSTQRSTVNDDRSRINARNVARSEVFQCLHAAVTVCTLSAQMRKSRHARARMHTAAASRFSPSSVGTPSLRPYPLRTRHARDNQATRLSFTDTKESARYNDIAQPNHGCWVFDVTSCQRWSARTATSVVCAPAQDQRQL